MVVWMRWGVLVVAGFLFMQRGKPELRTSELRRSST
jgi:hypothetical protein